MEDQNESIMNDMEGTRSALTEKLEALESQVLDKTKPVAEAVERVTEAAAAIAEDVKETVHGVKETVHEVKESVEETVSTVSSAFSIRKHTERHPWAVFSLATTAGCILGSALGRSAKRAGQPLPAPAPPRHKHGKGAGNGWSHRAEAAKHTNGKETAAPESLFAEELHRLKGLALGALMAAVRDLAKRVLPDSLASKVAEEVDSLTVRLGAEPIRGPVLPEQRESGSEQERENAPKEGVNRLRTGGSGLY